MKPKLAIVPPSPNEPTLEQSLRALLREERRLELKLIATRTRIAPLKRAYAEKTRTFGRSNEALLKALIHKD